MSGNLKNKSHGCDLDLIEYCLGVKNDSFLSFWVVRCCSLKTTTTFDLKFGHYVEAMDLGKILKFQYFIASSTEDMDSYKMSQGSKMTPSVLLMLNGPHHIYTDLFIFYFL